MNDKSNRRTCIVKGEIAWFHKWNTIQQVIEPSPMMGGHQGGQIQYTLGLIERPDGSMFEVSPKEIQFINGVDLNSAADIIRKEMLTHGAWYIAMVKSLASCLESNFSYIKTGGKSYEDIAKNYIDNYFL